MIFVIKHISLLMSFMKYLPTFLKSRNLWLGFLIVLLIGCEVTEPILNPDYTGQKGQITDVQGNVYKTIGIGSQIWMTENLKTTKLNDGTIIPNVTADTNWTWYITPGYCWYNNDSISFRNTYGPLYNCYAVSTGLLCPTGWHVPDKSEWETLAKFLGGTDVASGKLKDYYTSLWNDNLCIVNNYGFAALPGGRKLIRNYKGEFKDMKYGGYWWTSTWKDDFTLYSVSMYHDNTILNLFESSKRYGYSVRCIKD
jgi:uncharacterized protein (TIGR02145 family)